MASAIAVFTLILIGQGLFIFESYQATQGAGVHPVQGHTFAARLASALDSALGPSDRGRHRFVVTSVRPDTAFPAREDVAVTWSINNDLLSGTVGNGAQFDAYAAFRAVYSSGLAVARLTLTGTYPMTRKGKESETVVMRLSMDRRTAKTIANVGWDSLDAQSVWPLIRRIYVAPEFAPSSTE